MRTKKGPPRQRCTSCRCLYRPSTRAAGAQRTCSPECREVRRRKLAKRRRARELDECRAEERERQRECRARQIGGEGKTRRLSRATLSRPEAILRDEIVESCDKMMRVSRATLNRRVGLLLGRAGSKLRQSETEKRDCHAPP